MTYDEIVSKIDRGDYNTKLPFEFYLKDKEKNRAYINDEARLIAQLKEDLEKLFGVENHPKKDRLWGLCWSAGHSAGLREVMLIYSSWVELLQ